MSPIAAGISLWAALFAMMLAWAIATPVSGGPDESGHIMKASAAVRGQLAGGESAYVGNGTFVLPRNVGDVGGSMTCYVGQLNAPASCAPRLSTLGTEEVTVDSGVAAYNPLYYALVGWPSLFTDGTLMVLLMRACNALLVSLFWAVALVALAFGRPLRMLITLGALTPMALYLGGVINPSGLETATTLAAFALVHTALSRRSPGWPLLVGLAIAAALLMNLRSISPLFLALAVAAAVSLVGFRRSLRTLIDRRWLIVGAALVPFAAAAVLWTVLVSSPSGFIPSTASQRPGAAEAFWFTLETVGDQFVQIVGLMGWFDAPIPSAVTIVWFGVSVGTLLLALLTASARGLLVLAGSVGALVLTPALLHAATAHEWGYIWQGRYSLPLFGLVAAAITLAIPRAVEKRTVGWRSTILVLMLALLQTWAFLVVLKRYVVGFDSPWSALWSDPSWTPPGGVMLPVAIFLAGALVLIGSVFAIGRATRRSSEPSR